MTALTDGAALPPVLIPGGHPFRVGHPPNCAQEEEAEELPLGVRCGPCSACRSPRAGGCT